jgi:hypothetical protein
MRTPKNNFDYYSLGSIEDDYTGPGTVMAGVVLPRPLEVQPESLDPYSSLPTCYYWGSFDQVWPKYGV